MDAAPIVGSVFSSQVQELRPVRNLHQPGLNQIGMGGQAEALVGMTWYGFPYNIVGSAISKIISGSGTYNVCAQVLEVKRNGVSKGGTIASCGELSVGSNISIWHRVWEDWHGAYWLTRSWHSFYRQGMTTWAPSLQVAANL